MMFFEAYTKWALSDCTDTQEMKQGTNDRCK